MVRLSVKLFEEKKFINHKMFPRTYCKDGFIFFFLKKKSKQFQIDSNICKMYHVHISDAIQLKINKSLSYIN